jgi:hypothetical protein
MPTAARLPGVLFQTTTPPLAQVLPRTDVAVFVGFASSGPINIPVRIEDVARFADVFGADLPLAWNPDRGEMEFAYLAAAVRAFFRNGGRRCWVIRAAGPAANAKSFVVPGLMTVDAKGALTPAAVEARSAGSWANELEVAAVLVSELIPITGVNLTDEPNSLALATNAPLNIAASDLIRVSFTSEHQLLFPVWQVSSSSDGSARTLTWERSVWLGLVGSPLRLGPISPPPGDVAPTRAERLTFELWVRRVADTQERFGLRVYRAEESQERFGRLGFAPAHPAYWAALPTDTQLFGDTAPDEYAGLWQRASSPRWPLAGTQADWSIPLDMPCAPDFLRDEPQPSPLAEKGLDRDGLSEFNARLFLGEDHDTLRVLVDSSVERLQSEADFLRWSGESEQLLPGIYAALGIEEATLIAAPDAVHRGWRSAPPVTPITPTIPAPTKPPPPCPTWDFEACRPPDTERPAEGPPVPHPLDTRPPWELNPVEEFQDDTLLAIHRSLLRLCAARGDLLAVLGMPEHFREREAIAYVDRLTSTSGPDATVYPPNSHMNGAKILCRKFSDREAVALSYGATYHPWLYGREENNASIVRRVPPDGAACGILAKRAIDRGPWVAPANERYHGVVGLIPNIDPAFRLALQEARINLIRREARGFLAMSADTLSSDEELRPINVRRLLILLRRVALRVGADYVFEPNDPPFRRAVQRGFEGTMEYLFDRGAFAGGTHAESFRVVVDDTVNLPARLEQGQFVVELRVAPSRPLTFLTVRLLQSAERGAQVGGS